MGCGTSTNAVGSQENPDGRGKVANGNGANGHGGNHDDDIPTVVLTETPIKPKPHATQNSLLRSQLQRDKDPCTNLSLLAIAFEIPLEEFEGAKRPTSPPAHLQRLLQPAQAEITLPVIEEKLAEAEQRRQTILQQRAASAQKRTQKMMRVHEMDRLDAQREHLEMLKHSNTLTIPPEPGVCEDKNIT